MATWTWGAHVVLSDCKSSSDPAGSLNLRGLSPAISSLPFPETVWRPAYTNTQINRKDWPLGSLCIRLLSLVGLWSTDLLRSSSFLAFNRTKLHLTAWTPLTLNSSTYPLLSSNFKHVSIAHPWKLTQCLEVPFLDRGQAQQPVKWLRKYQNSLWRGQLRLSKLVSYFFKRNKWV